MKRVKAVGLTLGIVALAAVTTACGGGEVTADVQPAAATLTSDAPVPAAVKVPQGNKAIGKYEAVGVQTYQCSGTAWKLLEPAATLTDKDGKPIMLHSRGPVWVSTVDGSAVEAAAVEGAKADRPNAVPEVLLKTKTARGEGLLGKVNFVQRLRTEGGVAPAGNCTADSVVSVPYSALYVFWVPAS